MQVLSRESWMVSKRQKVIAVVIVVLPVMTGIVYLTIPAAETPADKLILKPADIGPEWQGAQGPSFPFTYPGETSSAGREYWTENSTSRTVIAAYDVLLIIFNSTASCLATFDQLNSIYSSNNYTSVSIGDAAFYSSIYPMYVFAKGNVFCRVVFERFDLAFDQQLAGVLRNIVDLQLNKIDLSA